MSARYARRIDDNARSVVNALRAMGCIVEPHQGTAGAPDLLVGLYGLTELVEVKPDVGEKRRRDPRESQVEWAEKWKGRKPVVVRNLDDCRELVSRMRSATQGEAP